MNLAIVSQDWKITIPPEICRYLGLKPGDRVGFLRNNNVEITMCNASATALSRAQEAFSGVAERLGVRDEADVQALVDSVRH